MLDEKVGARSGGQAGSSNPSLAVFCDFDGTFSVEDVGASLAREHLAERRAALWKRLAAGELTPWSYNVELFEGFAFGESQLEAVSLHYVREFRLVERLSPARLPAKVGIAAVAGDCTTFRRERN